VETLMERAGMAAARAIRLFAGESEALILCGPETMAATAMSSRGRCGSGAWRSASSARRTSKRSGRRGSAAWGGEVQSLAEAIPAPLLVDALFGTGLTRGLDDDVAAAVARLAAAARVRVAVDLPSGISTDDGRILSPVPDFDLTVTFATLKPSHLLQPSASLMGRIVVADIGVEAESRLQEIGRPSLRRPALTITI
jgi:NAD(P)H-hydrate repair Nnr-like enzyme with NAD(P)H-hydrate epimerase domain